MTRIVGALLVTAWGLLGLAAYNAIDLRINSVVLAWRTPWLVVVAAGVSLVLSPAMATLFGAGLAVQAWRLRSARLLRGLALFLACWSTVLVRYLYRRVRPVDHPQWAYPSGHVTAVTAVAFTLVVLLGRGIVLGAIAVLLTAVSRVVLNVHWFTDVVGAMCGVVGIGLLAAYALGLLGSKP